MLRHGFKKNLIKIRKWFIKFRSDLAFSYKMRYIQHTLCKKIRSLYMYISFWMITFEKIFCLDCFAIHIFFFTLSNIYNCLVSKTRLIFSASSSTGMHFLCLLIWLGKSFILHSYFVAKHKSSKLCQELNLNLYTNSLGKCDFFAPLPMTTNRKVPQKCKCNQF